MTILPEQRFPSVPREFQAIRDQFLGDPWIHFCNGFSEVYNFFLNKRNDVLLTNNQGTSVIGGMFISYDG